METSVEHRNGRAGWARAGWTACVLGCMVPALLWGEETTPAERAFTSAQTVDEVIAGDTAVRIAVPANTFVSFTGANTYTGGTVIERGGVIVSNVTALGTGPITCANGTAIRVCVDFADHEGGLQELIDRITVTPVAEGEPWVSFQLMAGGLANDVDFSKQPYLWLGAPGTGDKAQPFKGTLVPYGNEYRFGYAQSANNEARGLDFGAVLTDAPDGRPRRVLLRGWGVTTLSGGTYTGGIVVEGPAYLALIGPASLGASTNLTLRGGAQANFKNVNVTYPADLEIRNEGTNVLHSCGASAQVCTVFKGPITGWGKIRLTDQGGVRFTSASNTFTGTLELVNDHRTYGIEIGIGDGANCSWKGDRIIQKNTTGGQNPSALTNNFVQVNCNDDFTLETDLGAPGGRLVKKGTGTLTLAKPFARTPRRVDQPVIEIHEGTLRLTALEPTAATGLVFFKGGATLDLNGIAATSLWLPYGTGNIVNPADGAMVLEGTANAQTAFNGTLGGDVTVRVTGNDPWQVGDRTHIDGTLALASGNMRVNQGFTVDELDVDARARLLFNSDLPTDVGLKMEIWCNGNDTAWSGGDHAAKFATACAEMEKRKPDVTGDMADFLDGTFASGSDPSATPTPPNAFTAALGSGPNNFIARFTGYFHAEVEGTYSFKVYADDAGRLTLDGTNRVVNVAAGTKDAAGEGSVWLDAGWHPIEVLFNEETGWEYIRVTMKAPEATAFEVMPLRLLSTMGGRATRLPRVTGAGALELMPGAVWPEEMGLADFTGVLTVNDRTAEPDVGTVTPATALLSYTGTGSLAYDWSPKGLAVYEAGDVATLCGKANSWGSLNTTARIPLDKPFEVAFDFSAVQPWGSSLGDGFVLALHDGTVGYHGGLFSYSSATRINEASAYGMQFYLMPDMTVFSWVRDNVSLGAVVTNAAAKAFKMNNLKNSPMRVALAWDGEKNLVATLEKGTARWCSTNAFAAADLPARFPNGAYLGIWAQNGGYYTAERVEKLSLVHGGMSGTATKQVFNGTLGLTNGTVTAALAGSVQAELAADLAVTGAGTLTVEDGRTLACTGTTWTFDLANPEAKLTCTGALTFPTAPITVDVTAGEATARTRVLADLTGVADGAAQGLSFRLADDLPAAWKLRYRDGLLSLTDGTGTALILR